MVFYCLECGECLAPLPCSTWASSKEGFSPCTRPRTTQVSAHAAPLPVDSGDWWTLSIGILLCPWIMFLCYLSEREGVVRGAALGTL